MEITGAEGLSEMLRGLKGRTRRGSLRGRGDEGLEGLNLHDTVPEGRRSSEGLRGLRSGHEG